MLKNTVRQKTMKNFDMATVSLIQRYQTISIRLKIRISRLVSKTELKQRSLGQIKHLQTGHIQI